MIKGVKESVKECFDSVEKIQAEILEDFEELRNFTTNEQADLRHVAFEHNYDFIKANLSTKRNEVEQIVEFEEQLWKYEKETSLRNRALMSNNVVNQIQDFQINLVRYLECSLLEEHAADFDKKDDQAKEKYFRERFHTMIKTQIKTPLFAEFYYPESANQYPDELAVYKRFGFYWPTIDDLMQLTKDHPGFTICDLTLQEIRWKKEGCGFGFIQLVFRKGITSPKFIAEEFDAENFLTTTIRGGRGDAVRCIRVRTAGEDEQAVQANKKKYVEQLQFLNEMADGDEEITKKDPRVVCHIEPCRCGNFEVFQVAPGYQITGLFGIWATDRFCWTKEKLRHFENIRSLGFITMKVQP